MIWRWEDLNGDGKPDILSTEQSSDLLSLFQNQSGPGGFTNSSLGARVDLAVIANPWGECVADLEGDGRPAIIFANQFSSYFSIYQNLTPFGGPPVITQQPTNQTVASGNAAMFSVAATGSTPLSYQWNFEGTNILEATNTTLILTNVQLSQSGSYAVLVTNTLGSVLSSNAFLAVVLSPPTITNQPASLTNNAGTTATFSVTAGGSLPLSYQWLKNSSPMMDGGNVSGSATANLTLTNVQDSDVAGYTVAITNVAGSVTSSVAKLVVIDPPTIIQQPTNLTVNAGGTAVFAVTAGGTLPLSYQWQENGFPLTDGGSISGSATPILTLTSVTLSNMANYSVVVTNAAGSITSSNASLTVDAPPTITLQPISLTNLVGTTASFAVMATGSLPLDYQWNFNGTNINGATNLTLTLGNVQTNQAGNYAVLVTNNYGAILSSNAMLTVNPLPTNIPVIYSFAPRLGQIGTVVNVNGLNFSSTPGNNIVYVGAVQAVVSAASATNLTVTVPAGATYGPITETVNGLVAYSSGVFEPTFYGNGSSIGPSTFAARQDIPTPSGPIACAVGDLNGDGKLDVVVANSGAGSISIFQNIGSGGPLGTNTFGPPINLPTGGSPRSVTVADVDGDGKLDILVPDTGLSQYPDLPEHFDGRVVDEQFVCGAGGAERGFGHAERAGV